jgi:hypothetical protein
MSHHTYQYPKVTPVAPSDPKSAAAPAAGTPPKR